MLDRQRQSKPAFMYPWPKRTLFIGKLPASVEVSYGAATLVVSLGNPIAFSLNGSLTHSYSFLLPAGLQVILHAGNETVAIVHLDVLGEDFARFQGSFLTCGDELSVSSHLRDEADYRFLFQRCFLQPSGSAKTYHQLNNLLEYSFSQAGQQAKFDRKICAAVDYIKQSFQDNIPIDELAKQVQLSKPSLIRRFKMQSGVPIRRFRLWHRIYESMLFISEGQSLTDAAINAGFSDSPHYTHVVSSMWGVSPSDLFMRNINVDIIPPIP